MVKTLIGSAQLNHCDRVFIGVIGAMAMVIGTLPHISALAGVPIHVTAPAVVAVAEATAVRP